MVLPPTLVISVEPMTEVSTTSNEERVTTVGGEV